MSNMMNQTVYTQKGAVLVVSLIILLLMTLVGVTAMQVGTVQEKMASNLREQNIAFQAAEAALRRGEQVVPGGNYPDKGCTKGYCKPENVTGSGTPAWVSVDWNDSDQVLTDTKGFISSEDDPVPANPLVARRPRHIIEDISAIPTTGSGGGTGWEDKDTNKTKLYRITAQGYGLAADVDHTGQPQPLARVMLQSIYNP